MSRNTLLLTSLFVLGLPAWAPSQDRSSARTPTAAAAQTRPEVTLADLLKVEKTIQDMYARTLSCTVGVGRKGGPAGASGVIVSEDGLILTCAHVTRSTGDDVDVYLSDGRKLQGRALGSNSGADAAMIQITTKGNYPFAKVRSAGELERDDWCIMIGHPQSLQKARSAPVRIGRFLDLGKSRRGYVRTSCTMMGGDSGGPLFDMQGRVVGINSNIGIPLTQNYHVPSNAFLDAWDRLVKGERWGTRRGGNSADRVVLGMNIRKNQDGSLRISRVQRYASAEVAGIKVGDALIKVAGKAIDDPRTIAAELEGKKAGDKLTMTLARGEEEFEVSVRLLSMRQVSAAMRRDRGQRGSQRQQGSRRGSQGRTPTPAGRTSKRWLGTGPGNPFREKGKEPFYGSYLDGVRKVLDHVVAPVSTSVVPVYVGEMQVAMATAVRKGGYLVTKASEIQGQRAVAIVDGRRLPLELVQKYGAYDLALVKIDADLPPVVLSGPEDGPRVGTVVTGAGPGGAALELGLVSVHTRAVDSRRPYLGVSFETRSTGLRVRTIQPGSAAAKMGLVAGDEVLELNGKPYDEVAPFIADLKKLPAGADIRIGIDQEGALLVLEGRIGSKFNDDRVGRLHLAGGQLSKVRVGFATAIQTDLTLDPDQCGSPLVGLDGQVLGINIARSRRVASYAIPSSTLRQLLAIRRVERL